MATINQRGPYQFQAIVRRKGYPLDVMLFCVRWYVAYALSLRNLEKITIDKSGANTAAVLSMIAEPSSAERDPCWDSKNFFVPQKSSPALKQCT